jgi:diaminopimelate epimerase
MPKSLPFVKASACGNDFIIIDGQLVRPTEMHSITRAICHRHLGVGADGVEWLFPSQEAHIEARLINSDGSDAEVSGNGTRCVAAWYALKHGAKEVRLLTGAGVKTYTLTTNSGMDFEFRSDMGEPQIAGEITLSLSSGSVSGLKLSVGNPQFVSFVDHFKNDWQMLAAEIERHREFSQRTNVEFVKIINPHEIELRIFERGAGETLSSGTGSCAAAVAAIHTGRAQSPVKVVSPGGPQIVEWQGRISLTGPARILCEGEFYF